MKKIFLIFSFVFLFVLVSCGEANTTQDVSTRKAVETETKELTEEEKLDKLVEEKVNEMNKIPEDNSDIWGSYKRLNYTYTIDEKYISGVQFNFEYERIGKNIIKFDNKYCLIIDSLLIFINDNTYIYAKE